jgi:ADP-heptose:LPS heptosyltransferase
VQPALLRLFESRLPGVRVVPQGGSLPAFDLHCPLLSLPLVFGTTPATVPAPAAYLHADAARLARWAPLLAGLERPRIGIAWAGNPRMRGNRWRSPPLAALLPLFATGASWVSLQKEVPEHDRATIARVPRLRQLGPLFADFADTAAVMAQLDLVVTVCTSVAHLAGALGRPTWVMLSRSPDWRWLLDRGDSPWYPTARLFRQTTAGDWDGVVGQVQAALARLPGRAAG